LEARQHAKEQRPSKIELLEMELGLYNLDLKHDKELYELLDYVSDTLTWSQWGLEELTSAARRESPLFSTDQDLIIALTDLRQWSWQTGVELKSLLFDLDSE
jgi:hypothetical protein